MPFANRKKAIRDGLRIARRADGGATPSFLDMVAQNPHGWGMSPPPPSEPTAGQISSARDYLIERDAAGNPDADAAQATGDLFPAISGINAAQRAGSDFARGNYKEGAGNAALAVAPYLGGPAVSAAIKYGPRVAAPLVGGATLFTPSEAGPAGGPESEILDLQKRLAALTAKRDEATTQFLGQSRGATDELQGKGKSGKGKGDGPISRGLADQATAANAVASQYTTEIAKVQARLDELHHQMTPEYAREQELAQHNVDARKPWYERTGVPGFEFGANWGPWAAAALLTRGKFNKISGEGESLLNAARTAATTGDRAAAQVALDAWKQGAKGITGEYAKTVGKAALLPGGVRTTGNIGDAVFGPEVKDAQGNVQPGGAKQQAQGHLGRMFGSEGPRGMAEEWGPQALQGAEATALGAMLARRAPMGGINGELAHLRGVDSSLAPDQMAVELAKRRAVLSDSDAGKPTGPTPLWSQTMRGEPSRPALPPPTAKALSDTQGPPIPAPPPTSSEAPVPAAPLPPPSVPSQSSASLPPVPAVRPVKDKGGRWRHPNTGNFASAPAKTPRAKATANKAPKQPKAKASSQDDVPLDKNGIPIKPDRVPSDDDPGMRKSGGGVFSHAMNLARKYAKGGAVVGALVGNTGGRADKLSTSVPAGSHVIPSDVVSHYGSGNTLNGLDILKKMFRVNGTSARADGGAVPVYLSDGEFVVPPEAVQAAGGHDALDRFILQSRQDHINTLASLPPPARD